jgi:hypothetical protein
MVCSLDCRCRAYGLIHGAKIAGQTPNLGLTVNGISDFASVALNENQRQINNFGILAWQKRVGDIDFQIAGFTRYSSAYFSPGDPTGDLLFNGIAQTAYRQSWASGVQATGAGELRPTTRFAAAFISNGSARRSAPPQMFCQSTRTAFRRATSRSRSSIRAARLAGSTAIICRMNGK